MYIRLIDPLQKELIKLEDILAQLSNQYANSRAT